MSVRVHIDRLVVDAGVAGDAARLEAGIVAALGDALSGPHPAWWSAGARLAVVHATLPSGAEPGAQVAAAIHAGLIASPATRSAALPVNTRTTAP